MPREILTLATMILFTLAGCKVRDARPVEDLVAGRDLSRFVLTSISGTRDGDKLDVRAEFRGAAGELINLNLRFTIGVPTSLKSGTWTGLGTAGALRQRSVTFLGGQSGPPSVGGKFDLLTPDGVAQYRVTIPLQELKHKL